MPSPPQHPFLVVPSNLTEQSLNRTLLQQWLSKNTSNNPAAKEELRSYVTTWTDFTADPNFLIMDTVKRHQHNNNNNNNNKQKHHPQLDSVPECFKIFHSQLLPNQSRLVLFGNLQQQALDKNHNNNNSSSSPATAENNSNNNNNTSITFILSLNLHLLPSLQILDLRHVNFLVPTPLERTMEYILWKCKKSFGENLNFSNLYLFDCTFPDILAHLHKMQQEEQRQNNKKNNVNDDVDKLKEHYSESSCSSASSDDDDEDQVYHRLTVDRRNNNKVVPSPDSSPTTKKKSKRNRHRHHHHHKSNNNKNSSSDDEEFDADSAMAQMLLKGIKAAELSPLLPFVALGQFFGKQLRRLRLVADENKLKTILKPYHLACVSHHLIELEVATTIDVDQHCQELVSEQTLHDLMTQNNQEHQHYSQQQGSSDNKNNRTNSNNNTDGKTTGMKPSGSSKIFSDDVRDYLEFDDGGFDDNEDAINKYKKASHQNNNNNNQDQQNPFSGPDIISSNFNRLRTPTDKNDDNKSPKRNNKSNNNADDNDTNTSADSENDVDEDFIPSRQASLVKKPIEVPLARAGALAQSIEADLATKEKSLHKLHELLDQHQFPSSSNLNSNQQQRYSNISFINSGTSATTTKSNNNTNTTNTLPKTTSTTSVNTARITSMDRTPMLTSKAQFNNNSDDDNNNNNTSPVIIQDKNKTPLGFNKTMWPVLAKLTIRGLRWRQVPAILGNLPSLTFLDLSFNHITSLMTPFPVLAQNPHLTTINLSYNRLKHIGDKHSSGLPSSITHLDASHNSIESFNRYGQPLGLPVLVSLRYVDFSHNKLAYWSDFHALIHKSWTLRTVKVNNNPFWNSTIATSTLFSTESPKFTENQLAMLMLAYTDPACPFLETNGISFSRKDIDMKKVIQLSKIHGPLLLRCPKAPLPIRRKAVSTKDKNGTNKNNNENHHHGNAYLASHAHVVCFIDSKNNGNCIDPSTAANLLHPPPSSTPAQSHLSSADSSGTHHHRRVVVRRRVITRHRSSSRRPKRNNNHDSKKETDHETLGSTTDEDAHHHNHEHQNTTTTTTSTLNVAGSTSIADLDKAHVSSSSSSEGRVVDEATDNNNKKQPQSTASSLVTPPQQPAESSSSPKDKKQETDKKQKEDPREAKRREIAARFEKLHPEVHNLIDRLTHFSVGSSTNNNNNNSSKQKAKQQEVNFAAAQAFAHPPQDIHTGSCLIEVLYPTQSDISRHWRRIHDGEFSHHHHHHHSNNNSNNNNIPPPSIKSYTDCSTLFAIAVTEQTQYWHVSLLRRDDLASDYPVNSRDLVLDGHLLHQSTSTIPGSALARKKWKVALSLHVKDVLANGSSVKHLAGEDFVISHEDRENPEGNHQAGTENQIRRRLLWHPVQSGDIRICAYVLCSGSPAEIEGVYNFLKNDLCGACCDRDKMGTTLAISASGAGAKRPWMIDSVAGVFHQGSVDGWAKEFFTTDQVRAQYRDALRQSSHVHNNNNHNNTNKLLLPSFNHISFNSKNLERRIASSIVPFEKLLDRLCPYDFGSSLPGLVHTVLDQAVSVFASCTCEAYEHERKALLSKSSDQQDKNNLPLLPSEQKEKLEETKHLIHSYHCWAEFTADRVLRLVPQNKHVLRSHRSLVPSPHDAWLCEECRVKYTAWWSGEMLGSTLGHVEVSADMGSIILVSKTDNRRISLRTNSATASATLLWQLRNVMHPAQLMVKIIPIEISVPICKPKKDKKSSSNNKTHDDHDDKNKNNNQHQPSEDDDDDDDDEFPILVGEHLMKKLKKTYGSNKNKKNNKDSSSSTCDDLYKTLQKSVFEQLFLVHAEGCAMTIAEPRLVGSEITHHHTDAGDQHNAAPQQQQQTSSSYTDSITGVFSVLSEHFTLASAKYFLRENSISQSSGNNTYDDDAFLAALAKHNQESNRIMTREDEYGNEINPNAASEHSSLISQVLLEQPRQFVHAGVDAFSSLASKTSKMFTLGWSSSNTADPPPSGSVPIPVKQQQNQNDETSSSAGGVSVGNSSFASFFTSKFATLKNKFGSSGEDLSGKGTNDNDDAKNAERRRKAELLFAQEKQKLLLRILRDNSAKRKSRTFSQPDWLPYDCPGKVAWSGGWFCEVMVPLVVETKNSENSNNKDGNKAGNATTTTTTTSFVSAIALVVDKQGRQHEGIANCQNQDHHHQHERHHGLICALLSKEDFQLLQVPTNSDNNNNSNNNNDDNDDTNKQHKVQSRASKAPLVFMSRARVSFLHSHESKKSPDLDIMNVMKKSSQKKLGDNNHEHDNNDDQQEAEAEDDDDDQHHEMLFCVAAQQRASYLRMLNSIIIEREESFVNDKDGDNGTHHSHQGNETLMMKTMMTNIVGVSNWEETLPTRGPTLSIWRK